MKTKKYDVIIIGSGAAGIASAVSCSECGLKTALIDRESLPGGILLQCIHNGFGLHRFKEELTGPEYAEKYITLMNSKENIDLYLKTFAVRISLNNDFKKVYCYSKKDGVTEFEGKAIILAMGCRERNRGNIGTAGTRASGIFTAGLAQRLLNIEGYVPGKRIVIVGSGDIGLIMARRLTWVGAEVLAVVEIMPFPSGITRNIVQCLNDFDIPLYLSHIVSKIHGKDRVEKVTITPLEEGIPDSDKSFEVVCDTVLFSVGLIPETEIAQEAGVEINYDTNGPYVDANLMTKTDGIFACGNVLHVHDLVDFVSEESERCGRHVYEYITNKISKKQFNVMPGPNIKYVIPNRFLLNRDNVFFMRSMIIKNDAELIIKINDNIIKTKKQRHVQPSEMISIKLAPDFFKEIADKDNPVLEFSIR